jgi:signal transduction histidine kinase
MKHSIRRRLSLIIIFCSVAAVGLSAILINGTINKTFNNSIKFTNHNGTIWINISSNIKSVMVQIKDNGIGIKKEDLPFIFERMYRGDKSRQKIEGSGIGLTIAKKILTLHSATIDVESNVNRGSIFTVALTKNKKIKR